MKRFIEQDLINWKNNPNRKVLLIRGARQVGKTWSVRELGRSFDHYLEVNFEIDRDVRRFFESDLNPDNLCRNLSAYYNIPIQDGKTLLFFDEIQACLPALSSLRFFYEKRTRLHLIAAGSLLEFAFRELPSYGVGRIENLFMYPLSFDEYLIATGQEHLHELKKENRKGVPVNPTIHKRLINYLKQFLILGGLPEVIQTFINTNDFAKSQLILDQLITGFEDDFAKYKERVPVSRIMEVFRSVVLQAGNKFIVSKASDSSNNKQINEALGLLEMAGLVYRAKHTAANGLPLGAEVNQKKFKTVLFDHGIFQRILGLDFSKHLVSDEFEGINKGNIAEQYVGIEIIKNKYKTIKPQLYYWHREKRGSNAEVDYLIQKGYNILPIEVKSGSQGKMQSLRIFLKEKKISKGIRISLENFTRYENIEVFPLYAVQNIFN